MMMTSLYFAMSVMVLVSIGLMVGVAVWGRRQTGWVVAGVGGIGAGLLVAHATVWNDSLLWVHVMPLRELVIWGNVVPLGTGLLAGVVWVKGKGPWWWRGALATVILAMGIWRTLWPVWLEKPPLGTDKWTIGVCRQTSQASCSAAAAATLLKAYGIPATEREMVDLCLTSTQGTPMLGLYRGLHIKTEGTPYRVAAFVGNLDEFRRRGTGLAVISVGLGVGEHEIAGIGASVVKQPPVIDPRYENDWGWIRGVKHSVVASGQVDRGKVEVADPAVGRERWNDDAMRTLWVGEALYLVRR